MVLVELVGVSPDGQEVSLLVAELDHLDAVVLGQHREELALHPAQIVGPKLARGRKSRLDEGGVLDRAQITPGLLGDAF